MRKELLLIGCLIGLTANADFINDGYLLLNHETFDKKDIWNSELVADKLDDEQSNLNLGFNGNIEQMEYQLKLKSDEDDTVEIKKLFYIYDIADNLSLKLGKFIENWQLAYSLPTLDVTDPYYQPSINDPMDQNQGINAIALQYYGDDKTVTFYSNNDDEDYDPMRGYGYSANALRINQVLNDDSDLTFILHQKHGANIGTGVGIRNIVNDNLKLYSSFFSRRGTTLATHKAIVDNNPNYIATSTPIDEHLKQENKQYHRLMLGLQYTTDNNLEIIFEALDDKRRMDDQQWNTYRQMVNNHKNLPEQIRNPNLAWDLSLVNPNGLRQRYYFIYFNKKLDSQNLIYHRRISTDASALNTFQWQWNILDDLLLSASFSLTSGADDSEYRSYFPEQDKLSVLVRYNF